MRTAVWAACLLFLNACKEDPKPNPVSTALPAVVVLCEGTFQWSNASLDLWYPDSSMVETEAFGKANGRPLGDVAQSGLVLNNRLYAVVNNSGSILKMDPRSLKLQAQNRSLRSPRYAAEWQGKLWVSDLYASAISVLDTQTLETEGQVWASGWTEQMQAWQGRLAVAEYSGQVAFYDAQGFRVDSLRTQKGCLEVQVDARQNLWALCSDMDSGSALYTWSPSGDVRVFRWPSATLSELAPYPSGLAFLMNNRVWRLPWDAQSESDLEPLGQGSWTTAYALHWLPKRREFCLTDAKDFVSKGRLYRLSETGEILNQGDACSVAPGFAIERP